MSAWLEPSELRIGLGCLRLPPDEQLALATIAAGLDAGVTLFDTARTYGNEGLLARAVRGRDVRVVTKGGMTRDGARWAPDGRAKTIRADCEASLVALDGVPIDLYLVHAPDPRTAWGTTLRALVKLLDDGLVARVGVCNVSLSRLDEALSLAPIAAVQVAVSVFDDAALRGGVVARCEERGLALLAHSPLGGPRRAARLARDPELLALAETHGCTPAQAALARLLALSPVIVPIPGARTPEAARAAAAAAVLTLAPVERRRPAARREGEVVLVMGIPGAGKTRLAEGYAQRGHVRLNRDERGGSLRALAVALGEELAGGTARVVLDNTYLSRAERNRVVETAALHGVGVRCVFCDTPLAQAQANMVERLLDRFGSLPGPEELRASRGGAGVHSPTSQLRAARELEEPSLDEGFASLERVPFVRAPREGAAGVFVAAGQEHRVDLGSTAPHLLFDWRPGAPPDELAADAERLRALVAGPVAHAVCPHPGGPPACWCRPPLPGLPLALARAHGVDPARSTLLGASAAHRTLAATLGARFSGP